jgi:signal transduction histidine kinase
MPLPAGWARCRGCVPEDDVFGRPRMMQFLRSPLALFGAGVVLVTSLALVLVPGLVSTLLSSGQFMPHMHCYLGDRRMAWLQGFSDFLIGASYMLISAALAYLVHKARKDIPFEWMFLAFGIFIFSCGWTHFLEVWTLWHPTYWLSGGVKAVTAAASLATAAGFIYIVPHVFSLIQTAKLSEQRRQDLARTHDELRRAYQDLETFSYSLSHDIRGPLRAVNSFSRIVLEEHRGQLSDPGADMLNRVVTAAGRMDRLVNDVLALSRLSRLEIKTEDLQPEAILDLILQDHPDWRSPHAEVIIERPLLPVRGDAASLTQCLENLLGNAVKFVAPGVKPRVRIWTERVDQRVRLWVEDNGIGIASEAQQKIFEAFQRLHRREEYDGSGIGLAIVHKAVERMGAQVGVQSELGKGSRFWLDLAPAKGDAPAAA